VVFIPKGRRKAWYDRLRVVLGEVFREVARQKESKIEEGHLRPAHVHVRISLPPKYAVSPVVGDLKGKRAIDIARPFGGKVRPFGGERLWARGDCVSTVGRDEQTIRRDIEQQEAEDKRLEQLEMFKNK
jgi:putative transposase